MSLNRIDVHSHYLGGPLERWIKSKNIKHTGDYKLPVLWTDPLVALEFMDRHQIATQILSVPVAFAPAASDPGFVTRMTRELNEEIATHIKDHPGRFGGFATLPFDDSEHTLREIEYALDVLGMDGVMLTSNAFGHYLGQPFFDPIIDELARRDVPIFIHPVDCPHIVDLGFGRPSSIIEFPLDTARAVTNAIYSGLFLRHPNLKMILSHCGGVLPTLGWRIAEHTQMGRGPGSADIDPDHVSTVLRGLYYETALAGSRNSLLPTLEVTGPDHILFGTDYPAAPETTVQHNIDNLVAFDRFSEDDLTAIYRTNATRLFPRFA